jgi:ribonuclease P protein component
MRHFQGGEVDQSRVGFIIRKKVGKAVLRNAIRRILRELFRAHLSQFRAPTWVVFDVMNEASDYTRRQVRESADKLLLTLC